MRARPRPGFAIAFSAAFGLALGAPASSRHRPRRPVSSIPTRDCVPSKNRMLPTSSATNAWSSGWWIVSRSAPTHRGCSRSVRPVRKSSLVRAGLVPSLQRGAVGGSDSWFTTRRRPAPIRSTSWRPRSCAWRRPAERPTRYSCVTSVVCSRRPNGSTVGRAKTSCRGGRSTGGAVHAHGVREASRRSSPRSRRRSPNPRLGSGSSSCCEPTTDRPLLHLASGRSSPRVRGDHSARHRRAGQTITGPAEQVGVPGAVVGCRDAGRGAEQPTALPLLQFALTELFERREAR